MQPQKLTLLAPDVLCQVSVVPPHDEAAQVALLGEAPVPHCVVTVTCRMQQDRQLASQQPGQGSGRPRGLWQLNSLDGHRLHAGR